MSSKKARRNMPCSETWEQKKQVVSDTKDLTPSQVTDAKITTIRTMGVMGLTKDARLYDSLETATPDSTSSTTPVAESQSSLKDTNKVHTMLEKFEEMVHLYFPMPGEMVKPTALAGRHGIASVQKQDYSGHLLEYLRAIIITFQQYACQCSQGKVKDASQSVWEALQPSCLLLKHWIIALIHPITHFLKSMSLGLLLSIEELPINFQGKVQQVSNAMESLQASFSFSDSFLDLPRRILSPARKRLTKKYESLSELREDVVYNVPLSWFVAPFKTLRGRT